LVLITLVATGLGYETTRQPVAVDQHTMVALRVTASQLAQQEVMILELPARTRDKVRAHVVCLLITNLENPQVINAVPNQVIAEQELPASELEPGLHC
jgi:hypothetical protein